jgi:Fe-S cluster biogenesis protein NfuA
VGEAARYLTEGLRPHVCDGCGTTVLVKKNSLQHTSVQWQGATSACPCLGPTVAGCPLLRDSIDQAVRDGSIEVPADD